MMSKKAILITVMVIVVAGLAYLYYYGAKPPAEAMKPEVRGITLFSLSSYQSPLLLG